jgi:cadmium resistance transport/sequestration family protein
MPFFPQSDQILPLLAPLGAAISAFTATNLDDIVLLLLFFSQVGPGLRPAHIVAGQYLGFSLLVVASLGGVFGAMLLPPSWLGLLGLVPVSLGVSNLIALVQADDTRPDADGKGVLDPQVLKGWPFASVLSVAAVSVANGGDNIGIYLPLFAHASRPGLVLTLAVFFLMVGFWCLAAWRLTQAPVVAQLFAHYGRPLVPFVLIGLGLLILADSHTLDHRGLAVFSLACIGVMTLSLARQLRSILPPACSASDRSLLSHPHPSAPFPVTVRKPLMVP